MMPNLRQIISVVFLSCKIPRIVAGATPADLLCPQNLAARLLDKTHTYLYETRHLHDGRRDSYGFSEVLREQGTPHCGFEPRGPARRPDAAVYQRGDEPVQG